MHKFGAVGLVAALLAVSPVAQAANIVSNGDFSGTPGLVGWTATGSVFATNVGATSSNGGTGSYTPSTFAEFGTVGSSPTINQALPSNSLSQSISTVVGTNYVLTFVYGAFGDKLTGSNGMLTFSVVGVSHTTTSSASPSPNTDFSKIFKSDTLFFTADSATTTLNFVDTTPGNGGPGSSGSNGVITSINVANVPEPISMTLMLTAIVGLGAVRLRKSA